MATLPTEGKVVVAMARHGKPMTFGEIARATGEPRQKIEYHLVRLVQKGVVIMEKPFFRLQPPLYNNQATLVERLRALVVATVSTLDLREVNDPPLAVVETLRYFLSFYHVEEYADR